jgi:hypothetical protein
MKHILSNTSMFPNYLFFPETMGNPIYSPKKHTIQTYRSQQRDAKRRRRIK